MSFLSSWRTALRIARREARRAKGRSALVVAMIALPVLFLAFAAVSYDMFTLTGSELADRTMGAGTARIVWTTHQPAAQMPNPDDGYYNDKGLPGPAVKSDPNAGDPPPTQADLTAALPAGSTILPVRRGLVALRVPDGIGSFDAISVDADDPMASGYVSVLDGRAPTVSAEVALTAQSMKRLGVGIGGVITLGDGSHPYTVVGQVEFPSLLSTVVLFGPQTDPLPTGLTFDQTSWLVRTPGPVTWSDVLTFNKLGMVVTSRAVLIDPPAKADLVYQFPQSSPVDSQQVRFTVLIAGLGLLEIVLMAGPAFAVSARRRQRQLALVAANGGTPAHVRRIVLADGIVLGGVGAVAGIGLGIGSAFLARPFVEESVAHVRAGGYRVFPLALVAIASLAVVTGLLAALVPAFITARQNIIASLAGRRGVVKSRKRWLAVGLVTALVGAAVVYYGTSNPDTSIILAGLILGELGLVLCTPSLVGFIARIGRVLPLGPRIALRDAARNRASAAPAISAVMAAVAGSVAIGFYFSSNVAAQQAFYTPNLPTGYVEVLVAGRVNSTNVTVRPDQLDAALRSSLPVKEIHQLSQVDCPAGHGSDFCILRIVPVPELSCPYLQDQQNLLIERTGADARAAWADPRCADGLMGGDLGNVVDDGSGLAAVTGASGDDLTRAQDTLRAGGVVVRDPKLIKNGRVTLQGSEQSTTSGDSAPAPPIVTTASVPGYLLTTGIGRGRSVVSPAAVAKLGLASSPATLVVVTSRVPTQSEEDRLRAQLQALGQDASVERGAPINTDVRIFILMGAAAAITLAAAGIATALAAADGRADLSTLAAVGASPRLRRGLSLSQSGVIAGLGSILGALAGTGAAIAIIEVLNQGLRSQWPGQPPMPIALPWVSLAVALLVVPGIAMIGAGTLTRSRLPIERRL